MATEKTVNYTEAQTAELIEAYKVAPTDETVKTFATKFGKSARSIVAKLAKEHVYAPKTKEAGKRTMLKAEMVGEIAKLVGATDEQLESLEKATGPALMAVLKTLTGLAEQVVAARVAAVKAAEIQT